jgi:hypothetical protein
MELEKRVADIEMDLKVVKGEIKDLLVDIRDLINKSENPFYNNYKNRISIPETKEKDTENKNKTINSDKEKIDLKKSESILETELKDEKKDSNISPEPFTTSYKAPSYEVQEQKISRQNNTISETQVIESENQVRKIDTVTLVELMRWVDYAIRTIGHSNLESLLELYSLTGKLPEETKHIIKNIANISIEEPACEGKISMKDNIVVLSQLNAILNPEECKNGIPFLYEDSGSREDTKEKNSLPSIKCTNL